VTPRGGAGIVVIFFVLLEGCQPANDATKSEPHPFGCWRVSGAPQASVSLLDAWPGSELCIEENRWIRRTIEKRYHQPFPPRPFDLIEFVDGALTRWTRSEDGGAVVWRSDPIAVDLGALCAIDPAVCRDFRVVLQRRDQSWVLVAEPPLELTRLGEQESAELRRHLAASVAIESGCKAANACARALQALPPQDAAGTDGEHHIPRRSDYAHLMSCHFVLSPGFERRVVPDSCRARVPISRCLETHTPSIVGSKGAMRVTPCDSR
jgi:hypothetical protein